MSDSNDYPDSAYRGLTANCIDEKVKLVLYTAFAFEGRHKNENNFDELSINWNDDENSLQFLKEQKKVDSEVLKYANGIIRIPTKKLKEIKSRYKGFFLYERKPIEGNIYHGNLLLDYDNLSKSVRQMLMSELAASVDLIYTYNKESLEWE